MTANRFWITFALLGALVGRNGALPTVASAAPGETARFRTVPRTAGIELLIGGETFRSGRDGSVEVPARLVLSRFRQRAVGGSLMSGVPVRARIKTARIPNGTARFDRFYGLVIAISNYYRVRPRFLTTTGISIKPANIDSYTVRSRNGTVLTAPQDKPLTLEGTRVTRQSSSFVSKPIDWTFDAVRVDGANVVHKAQQRFDPGQVNGMIDVRLLYFTARVISRDALFGFPTGSTVLLTRPNGKVTRHSLNSDGELTLPILPRGLYHVAVEALGIAPARPMALSQDQTVELKVISILDIVVVVGFLGALAIGLLVLRRPALRRLIFPHGSKKRNERRGK